MNHAVVLPARGFVTRVTVTSERANLIPDTSRHVTLVQSGSTAEVLEEYGRVEL